ncbi:hypothetical protein EYF80_036268 [Liparis tanakae]|uniref:Uncharacterized protein n=1 Tax=Liparis tanakae TaxID=230148 RepID=A0A4Z2GJR2_9TELE|nr:hypothetical protein EYF80_036268 [Liparis tanakae]
MASKSHLTPRLKVKRPPTPGYKGRRRQPFPSQKSGLGRRLVRVTTASAGLQKGLKEYVQEAW